MMSVVARLILTFIVFASSTLSHQRPVPTQAEWCQCVIFVLNIIGIEQIPGDYWTAASLAVVDESGKTWMDYQGFQIRLAKNMPKSGDLLVLDGGADVITAQIWSGTEHLVPVPVDLWAGHIGIVETARIVSKEGQDYLQVKLLSSNWGVNAVPSGVIGSCYNVDESIFLIPIGYKKAHFFFADDPVKMRERIVNRAERWAFWGVTDNPLSSMDGFPITPIGFINAALREPGTNLMHPQLLDFSRDLNEIALVDTLPGDVISFGVTDQENGFGIVTDLVSKSDRASMHGIKVIPFIKNRSVFGPVQLVLEREGDSWIGTLTDGQAYPVKFLRFNGLPGYPILDQDRTIWYRQNGNRVGVSGIIANGGGQPTDISDIEIFAKMLSTDPIQSDAIIKFHVNNRLDIDPGTMEILSGSTEFPKAGNYSLTIRYKWRGVQKNLEDLALIQIK
jgi:hypothetical protein